MLLLVGLGNPGARHARDRHNVGFMAADAIAKAHRFGAWRTRFSSLAAEGQLGPERVLLLKPQTYMNLSGRAVAEAARFFKLPPAGIVVVHDEIDLAPGKVRIKAGGGVAGHNGLRSIAEWLGSKDFRRVRLGVGHPGDKERVIGHVLSDFAVSDRAWLEPLLDAVAEAAPLIAAGDDSGAMNRIALRTRPPRAAGERASGETDCSEAGKAPAAESGARPDPGKTE
jgi:peptidyl-tRNA hydrolase, PTH1 family